MVLDVTERLFAVLYVSIMGLARCYKTTVFLNIYLQIHRRTLTGADSDSTKLSSELRISYKYFTGVV